MLIKTTHDDVTQFFIGFLDDGDTQHDYDVTMIYYKIWAVNTGNIMLSNMFMKKMAV